MELYPSFLPIFVVFLSKLKMTSSDPVGTYVWKPRLGLEFRGRSELGKGPKIVKGKYLVLIEGYTMGISFIALAHGLSEGRDRDSTLNPLSGFFYTNVYRWLLRYMDMLPKFLGAHDVNIAKTHQVWQKRFTFRDNLLPGWMQRALFFVNDWDKVRDDLQKFRKHSESAFAKHYRFPSKNFDNFASEETQEKSVVKDLSESLP